MKAKRTILALLLLSLLPLASQSQDTIRPNSSNKYYFEPINITSCDNLILNHFGYNIGSSLQSSGGEAYLHYYNPHSSMLVYGVALSMTDGDKFFRNDSIWHIMTRHFSDHSVFYLVMESDRSEYPYVILDSTIINPLVNADVDNRMALPIPPECYSTINPYGPYFDTVDRMVEVYFDQPHLLTEPFWIGGSLQTEESSWIENPSQVERYGDFLNYRAALQVSGPHFISYPGITSQMGHFEPYNLDVPNIWNDKWGGIYPIITPPPCFVPQINSVEATSYQASVEWTEPLSSNHYRLTYGPSGFDPDTSIYAEAIDNVYGNHAILSNLMPNTTYDVYLQGICTFADTLTEACIATFTTLPLLCDTLSDLYVESVTEETAMLVCQANENLAYVQAEYGEMDFEPGSGTLIDSIAIGWNNRCWIQCLGLQSGVTYTLRARAFCIDEQRFTDWSETLFTTRTPTFSVTASVNDTAMGHVEGTGIYPAGQQVSLSAIPNSILYQFDSWENGSTSNPRIITLTQDTTVQANFSLIPDGPDNPPDSTGITSPIALTVKVHPNPVHGTLTAEMSQPDSYLVQLFDAQGRQLYSSNIQASLITLDMTPYPTGHYLLRLSSPSASTTLSVVKE